MTSLRAVLLILVATAACKADDPIDRPGEPDADTVGDLLSPPELDAVAERTPLATVAARGRTDGARVIGIGPLGSQLTAVLPGGMFCQDTRLQGSASNPLAYYAVGGDGRVSAPTSVEVIQDPGASEPSPGSCSGGGVACAASETCGTDGSDEDCDGWADACDAFCSGCTDDALEPNDVAINVPTIGPGGYDLRLCPCRDDWFAFHVEADATIRATVTFVHDAIDIDLRLYRVDGSDATGVQVASSVTTDDVETIAYAATVAGTYYLRVYPFHQDQKPSGTYRLEIPEP